MKFSVVVLLFAIVFSSCTSTETKNEESERINDEIVDQGDFLLPQGFWIGNLRINEVDRIPFNLEVKGDSVYFINADERIGSVVTQEGEQLVIKMPIFDSEFRFSSTEKGLYGFWFNYAKSEDYKIDFTAKKISKENASNRFDVPISSNYNIFEGNWETTFDVNTPDAYKSLGLLVQVNQEVTGTFLTETGDYRFLQGNATGDSLYLSAFDGSHAFMLKAKMDGDTLRGMFFSGNHYQNNWKAFRNDNFELTDPDSLTKLKIGEELSFSFPGLDGKMVSYPSPKYTEKVVIIQILGSWCPNCMDETKFLSSLHKTYSNQGLEVIGISFENPTTLEGKIERVKELKKFFEAEYDFCIGGDASKKTAEMVLPALDKVMSFPTTLYIDKDGVIRKIHTGFNGPGTGPYYLKYAEQTNKFVQTLLNE
jgi:thiol-disulfide isomerase/thioredoxin